MPITSTPQPKPHVVNKISYQVPSPPLGGPYIDPNKAYIDVPVMKYDGTNKTMLRLKSGGLPTPMWYNQLILQNPLWVPPAGTTILWLDQTPGFYYGVSWI